MSLERAYRRLLACYPWEHRRQYEEEMLGVLLDDAGPDRRRPPLRDVRALVFGALRARARYAGAALTNPRWREATAAVGLLAAVVMLAYAVRPGLLASADVVIRGQVALTESELVTRVHGLGTGFFEVMARWHSLPRLAAWAVVLMFVLLGWRRVAAAWAWLAAALEVVRGSGDYTEFGSLFDLWSVAMALLAATALTVAAMPGTTRGTTVLGRRRVALIAGAGLLVAAAPTVDTLLWRWFSWTWSRGTLRTGWIFTYSVSVVEGALIGFGLLAGALAVLTLRGPVRRRVLALLAPVVVTFLLTRAGFAYLPLPAGPRDHVPAWLEATRLVALALVPALTFAVAAAAVHRREQTLRLLALGRAADR
jgi:hypothetical protein